MLLPMLKAVSKMLDFKDATTGSMGVDGATRVLCAKVILDEIVAELTENPPDYTPNYQVPITAVIEKQVSKEKTQASTPQLQSTATLEPKPEVEVPTDKEWMVTLDDKKNLYIEGFPEDGMVELDGKKMKYSETRGIKFQKARIL